MSRTFWLMVGAAGGIYAYRRGTRAVARARELGPMGSAQVAAQATSALAGRAANGLGRLQEIQARREGRLTTGALQVEATPPPAGWVAAPEGGPMQHDPQEPVATVSPPEGAPLEESR